MKANRLGRHAFSCGKRVERGLATTLAAAWFCGGLSCLLITDRDKDQCATTADCANKGGGFVGTECVRGVCAAKATAAATSACASTIDCLANPDTPNTYCGADKQCLPMLNSNCTEIVTADGKPLTVDTILLGVLAPLSGDNATDGQARVRAVRLAHAEFMERAVGISAGAGVAPRPIGFVVCDQVADAESAAIHLAMNLHVPAIIGPGFSGTTVKVAKNVTIPNGVLLMSPSATTPDLATLQDDGLVWRTSSSFEPESKAYAELVARMEAYPSVRASLGLDSAAPIKVAILAKGDSYGKGLADLLSATLQFNGKGTGANGPAYFARFDLPDLTMNPDADTQSVVTNIVQSFKPHLLLAIGTAEVITKGLDPIEEQWSTGADAQPRPFYILSEGAKLIQLASSVAASVASHPDRKLKDRMHVFGPRYNDTLYDLLLSRYAAAYNNEQMPDIYGVTGSYDGFYLVAYALAAIRAPQPTGATIAEGLMHLVPPGTTISAGPYDVSKAIVELAAGRNIDYDGVTGPLDFDVATGDSPGDYNLYCVQSTGFARAGQYFDSRAAHWVGEYEPCP
jgi:branched-chain amino acid transport system substrate-binding protein